MEELRCELWFSSTCVVFYLDFVLFFVLFIFFSSVQIVRMQKPPPSEKKHVSHCLKKWGEIVWVLIKSFVVSLLDNSCRTKCLVCGEEEEEGGV